MRVLVLGGGGREHALAWTLRRSPRVERVLALPGSDGMAGVATCLGGDACDAATVLAAIAAHGVDLTVVGPEGPLAAGVSDALRAAGHAVFGPSRAAAQLESSKTFAKQFLRRHDIPAARSIETDDLASARRGLGQFGFPVVIKADGLAAGKGVVIAPDAASAEATLEAMLAGELVGAAGRRVVIEECLAGPELSVLALADGERTLLLPAARDHKRLGEGDTGPNTGGMGAYSSDALLPAALREEIERRIVAPSIAGMAAAGTPFQGVLYCGLMLTAAGPRVLEFNTRFGDPEAQAILMRWQGDLAGVLEAAARGDLRPPAPGSPALWSPHPAACVIAAAAGYPGTPERGQRIEGLEAVPPEAVVFHAGTRRGPQGWETSGGRVLGVAARAPHLAAALSRCYNALAGIQFAGMQYRADIGANQS